MSSNVPPGFPREACLTMMFVAADAITRAQDALGVQQPENIDWQYVFTQLTLAHKRIEACMMIADITNDEDIGEIVAGSLEVGKRPPPM